MMHDAHDIDVRDLQRGLLRTLKRLKRKPCVADRRNKIAGLRERLALCGWMARAGFHVSYARSGDEKQ